MYNFCSFSYLVTSKYYLIEAKLNSIFLSYLTTMESLQDFSSQVLNSWKQLYSSKFNIDHSQMQKHISQPLKPQENHTFGQFEEFRTKNLGPYHVIQNTSYAQKKGSPLIAEAKEAKSVKLLTKSKFDGFPSERIMVYIDLDKISLIQPKDLEKQKPNHFLLFKKYQFCTGHSLLIFNNKDQPQILTEQLILYLLKTSSIIPGFTFGYNSQGAASTLNIFHFQFLYHKELTCGQRFHFETISGKQLKKINLIMKQGQKPAMLFLQTFDFLGAIFIRIRCQDLPLSHPTIIQEVTNIIFKIVLIAFDEKIPHNINFPNQHNFYLILRAYATQQTRFGWIQYSGVFKTSNHKQFEEVTIQKIDKVYEELSLDLETKKKVYDRLQKL